MGDLAKAPSANIQASEKHQTSSIKRSRPRLWSSGFGASRESRRRSSEGSVPLGSCSMPSGRDTRAVLRKKRWVSVHEKIRCRAASWDVSGNLQNTLAANLHLHRCAFRSMSSSKVEESMTHDGPSPQNAFVRWGFERKIANRSTDINFSQWTPER